MTLGLINHETATCTDPARYEHGKGLLPCGKPAVGEELVTVLCDGTTFIRPLCTGHADEFVGDSLAVLRFQDRQAGGNATDAQLRARVPYTAWN